MIPCVIFWSATTPGTVSLPDGDRTDVAVVVQGDRIAAVGTIADLGLSGPTWEGQTCEAVDLAGHWLTPGLVATGTTIGLVEVSLEAFTRDDEGGGDDVRAALRVADAYNPRSALVPVARTGGVTSTVLVPSGGFVSGQAAWVDLGGTRQAVDVVDPSVAVVASLAPPPYGIQEAEGTSSADALLRLRELLDDTRAWLADPKAFDQNRTRPLSASRLDLDALGAVVRGEVPLLIGADRASDVESVLRFAGEQKVRVVIVGAAEGWLVADAIAAAGVPVVVDPLVYGPGTFDQLHARADNPALLATAGVDVVLSPFSSHHARTTAQVAGNAVRGGMTHEQALRAVTSAPADAFGLAGHGRIEVGAVANLVVWESRAPGWPVDPFETLTSPSRVFVRGVEAPLETRQTDLTERYRVLPGTPEPLSLP